MTLMRLHALTGERHLALRQYRKLRDALQHNLDAEPAPASDELHRAILSGRYPPSGGPSRPRNNLPAAHSSFIGREAEVAEGRRMSLEGALRYAPATAVPWAGGDAPTTPAAGPLSRREGAVAALIARGYTNREIAEALGIAESTAAHHVEHAMRRLGFHSRAELAAWIVERRSARRPRVEVKAGGA